MNSILLVYSSGNYLSDLEGLLFSVSGFIELPKEVGIISFSCVKIVTFNLGGI